MTSDSSLLGIARHDRPRFLVDISRRLDRVPRLKAVLKRGWNVRRYYRRRIEGEAIIRERYQRIHGQPLNVTARTRFTEKLNCRMVAMHRREHRLFTRLTDKCAVRASLPGGLARRT